MVSSNLFLLVCFLKSDKSNLDISSLSFSWTPRINSVLLGSHAIKVSKPFYSLKFGFEGKEGKEDWFEGKEGKY